jgi:spore germination cell wall hydrolase CwlJ-like protein
MKAIIVALAIVMTQPVFAGCDYNRQLEALALNMYHEARGEGEAGMRMVGEVTINRTASSKYPDTICGVVYQKNQFSWVSTKKDKTPKEKESWEMALKIAKELLDDDVNSYPHLATHFVNLNVAKPSWTKKFDKVKKIGDHTFYRM